MRRPSAAKGARDLPAQPYSVATEPNEMDIDQMDVSFGEINKQKALIFCYFLHSQMIKARFYSMLWHSDR